MTRCLKCGVSLPPVGECPACLAPKAHASPFNRELHLDRRRSVRESVEPAFVQSVAAIEAPPQKIEATPDTGVEPTRGPPASMRLRLLASAIDAGSLALIATLYLAIGAFVTGTSVAEVIGAGAPAQGSGRLLIPGAVLLAILALVYCTVAALFWSSTTLGRLLMGIELVDEQGRPPAPGRALARAGLSLVSFGLLLSGFWLALFDRRGQTLHDKLTSTFVVRPS